MHFSLPNPAVKIVVFLILLFQSADAQQAYFADGYHGGVYGHYPRWKTRFIVEELRKHPAWKINLEIEPETWDSVRDYDPAAYAEFKKVLTDSMTSRRIEFVNPSYGQSYLYNISGESVIRQFSLGIKKIKEHFPSADFLTYSSEEPCFTSALPQVLKSFGFKYAVLKNPNTCWGGYTRAFGGEKVDWVGPDGSSIPTVTRYDVERLQPGSTWQTIAWANTNDYIKACLNSGIVHPVGMCLQDAGWRGGPWLTSVFTKDVKNLYQPSQYIRWRDYFQNISKVTLAKSWKFSQEDVLVSLVWGSQVLQQLAQQVRAAENKIVVAEKLSALHAVFTRTAYPELVINNAWRTLLLAQHHDCWIVPYNGKPGNTWADKTKIWTEFTDQKSDSIITASLPAPISRIDNLQDQYIHVYNTTASARKEVVSIPLPGNADSFRINDERGKEIPSEVVVNKKHGAKELIFMADVPPVGFATFQLRQNNSRSPVNKNTVTVSGNNTYFIDTDVYQLIIDGSKGGIIKSLKAKKLHNREFVDVKHERSFNELRGFFYEQNKFLSSRDQPASITVLEDGPIRTKIMIEGRLGEHPFTQTLTLNQGDPKIDIDLQIDWSGNPGIGQYDQSNNFKAENPEKAFYNDKYKLLALFPVNFISPKVFKDAPFDVTESKLENTFFNRWDSIKNNVVLHWVDLEDTNGDYGMALLTDHTTSYAFGKDHPLGLTIQYSGKALWGRDYKITGPTVLHYALLPHAGKWDKAGISNLSNQWNEPLITVISSDSAGQRSRSWLTMPEGWELSALQMDGENILLRIFNGAGTEGKAQIMIDGTIKEATLVELNGEVIRNAPVTQRGGKTLIELSLPRFGIRTLRLKTQ